MGLLNNLSLLISLPILLFVSSLTINSDDLFKNGSFPQQFLQSLHLALIDKQLIDIELISGVGGKR